MCRENVYPEKYKFTTFCIKIKNMAAIYHINLFTLNYICRNMEN